MKTPGGRALGIVHTEFRGRPLWALVGEGALESMRADGITTGDLEALPLDAHRVETLVDHVMTELEAYGADLASTPGGAGWLYAQHVPTRRLVTQLVRKLLALSTWEPFAKTPGPLGLAPYEGFVGLRSNSSREYRAYTVTWSGVATYWEPQRRTTRCVQRSYAAFLLSRWPLRRRVHLLRNFRRPTSSRCRGPPVTPAPCAPSSASWHASAGRVS